MFTSHFSVQYAKHISSILYRRTYLLVLFPIKRFGQIGLMPCQMKQSEKYKQFLLHLIIKRKSVIVLYNTFLQTLLFPIIGLFLRCPLQMELQRCDDCGDQVPARNHSTLCLLFWLNYYAHTECLYAYTKNLSVALFTVLHASIIPTLKPIHLLWTDIWWVAIYESLLLWQYA